MLRACVSDPSVATHRANAARASQLRASPWPSCLRGDHCSVPSAASEDKSHMTEPTRESDQILQRRANFEALAALGIHPYPHKFERTHTADELVAAYGDQTGE